MIQNAVETAPARGSARVVRSSLFGGSAVLMALTAHVVGGGAAPSWGLVAVLVLAASVVTNGLAGRRRGHPSVMSALLLSQVLLHQAFSVLAGGMTCSVAPMAGMHHPMPAGLTHRPGMVAACTPAGAGMHAMAPRMLIGHALAAMLLAVLLSHGERAVWWVLTWFLPPVPTRAVPPLGPASSGPVALVSSIRPPRGPLSGGVGRRGPPTGLGAPV